MRAPCFLLFLLLAGLQCGSPCAAGAGGPRAPIEAPQNQAQGRQKALDNLFARLRQAPDAEAAARLRAAIGRLWGQSGSPTADLLMARAQSLVHSGNGMDAAVLLDRIVALYPDWTLAWRRRAHSALMQGDREGAMLDLDHALAIEPRNFLVMRELAGLLHAAGREAPALELLRRALELDPRNDELRLDAEKLERQIEGERI